MVSWKVLAVLGRADGGNPDKVFTKSGISPSYCVYDYFTKSDCSS